MLIQWLSQSANFKGPYPQPSWPKIRGNSFAVSCSNPQTAHVGVAKEKL